MLVAILIARESVRRANSNIHELEQLPLFFCSTACLIQSCDPKGDAQDFCVPLAADIHALPAGKQKSSSHARVGPVMELEREQCFTFALQTVSHLSLSCAALRQGLR